MTRDRNPFLLLLMKHILSYETGMVYGRRSNAFVEKYLSLPRPFVIKNPEAIKMLADKKEGKMDLSAAHSVVANVYEKISQTYRFSDQMLNRLVQSITFFGTYSDWDSFEKKHGNSDIANWCVANDLIGQMPITIDVTLKNELDEYTEKYFDKLLYPLMQSGVITGKPVRNYIALSSNYFIRGAEITDFGSIEKCHREGKEIANKPGANLLKILQLNEESIHLVCSPTGRIVGFSTLVPIRQKNTREDKDFSVPHPSTIPVEVISNTCQVYRFFLVCDVVSTEPEALNSLVYNMPEILSGLSTTHSKFTVFIRPFISDLRWLTDLGFKYSPSPYLHPRFKGKYLGFVHSGTLAENAKEIKSRWGY